MKQMIYILIFIFLMGCVQSTSEWKNEIDTFADFDTDETALKGDGTGSNDRQNSADLTDSETENLSCEFEKVTIFQLTDTIIADYNGDGVVDQAIFKREAETSGIIFTHGNSKEEIRIGFGESFAHLTEFNWVDFWGLVNDAETYEIVIEDAEIIGDRRVELVNPAIVVRKEEAGGGLITFVDGKYIWIQQAD